MLLYNRVTQTFRWWLYALMIALVPGCKKCYLIGEYEEVTVTLDGKPRTFIFGGKLGVSRSEQYLMQLLNRIEQGEAVDINQIIPTGAYGGERPLEMAVRNALAYEENRDLDLTRYLLIHGADPNKASTNQQVPIHQFIEFSGWKVKTIGYEIFTLLISYGARVDIPLKDPEKGLFIEELDRHFANEADKKAFFKQVVTHLLKQTQHKPLDPALVNYLEQIGLEADLVAPLKTRI